MRSLSLICTLTVINLGGSFHAMAGELSSLRDTFANPPREYATAPLWTWNDLLTEDHIVSTLHDLASQNVKQAFVHPRPGLMTPYLSEDWFRLWKKALETAEELDMNIWIYDENSYPSGFAGGFVPEAMPESRGVGIVFEETTAAPAWTEELLGVYAVNGDRIVNETAKLRAGEALPEGQYIVARTVLAGASPWFGGWWYVDLLRPGVTEKFIEITFDAYAREVGDAFGKRMPGIFTDEPHLKPGGDYHWTPDLPEVFEQRWGYDLLDHLASLDQPVGDWKRVRHNYYHTLLDLFIERWAKPCYDWCEERGLEFTGHYWEHGWPGSKSAPDNMAMYAWHQRPAIDTLFNQYSEDVNAQFGNTRAVLELASVANQLGKARTLCEAYGGAGWETRLEDMKRIGDWLYVLGVNTLDEHLSRISMRGARKADYPPSFSYHSPWWEAYHMPATYFARLAAALSHGEQVNEVLVLEPTTTAWMYQGEPARPQHLLGRKFQQLVVELAQAQVEFDIGCEDIIADHGSVEGDKFVIGQRKYHTVVIPPMTENLNSETAELLAAYVEHGGLVYAMDVPALIDGAPSDRITALAGADSWKTADRDTLAATLLDAASGIIVRRAEGDAGILHHHRRELEEGQLLFLVNSSLDAPARGTVENIHGAVYAWDAEDGSIAPYAASGEAVRFELPPAGSLLLQWGEAVDTGGAKPVHAAGEVIAAAAPVTVRREEPNVLTIDYVDVTCQGETRERVYFHKAAEFVFQKHGMDNNPWDHAVQFRDQYLTMTFPEDSGLTAAYRFTITGAAPAGLQAVVERPDLYTITCNGQPVSAIPGEWWFDKSFGVIDIAAAVKEGENTLTLVATPFTVFHEVASAYILGDFYLEAADSGFTITAAKELTLEPWNAQGMPLYGDSVVYSQTFDIAEPAQDYRVSLPAWYGSVAEVVVNGQSAGYVWCQPWQREFTGLIEAGVNTIDVRVIGTPKNTLGPHHGNHAPGLAGPEHFRTAPEGGPPPGQEYKTLGYGLFEPVQLTTLTQK
jgi:hypothetical protein